MKRFLAVLLLCALGTGCSVHALAAEVPAVSAASALLLDAKSGRVLYEQNADEPRAIASITKLMTALVAAEHFDDLTQVVTIRKAWTGIEGTSLYLQPGEKFTVETLLYGLLLQSGNDAAVALACAAGGTTETFVGWMNQRAAELGMTNTQFSDPNGLGGENHYSTARDMAKLGAACLQNEVVARIVSTRSITLEGRSLTNHNKLLWQYPYCTGMKTGYTQAAGRTLVSSAEKDGQQLVCVTLNDRNDWADHMALLDYGFAQYPAVVLAEEGESAGLVPVTGSLVHHIGVVVEDTLTYPLAEGEEAQIEVHLPASAEAPVTQGGVAGELVATVNGEEVGRTQLVWARTVPKDVIPSKTWQSLFFE